jgi:hypothetical protein
VLGGALGADAGGAARTIDGQVDEERNVLVNSTVEGRVGQARFQGLDERVGQDDVQLPL